jgi:HAD superfamily hydrolase (TIGR01549 family)
MIQAILFDLWNTLFINKSYSRKRLEKLSQFLQEREFFISVGDLRTVYDRRFHFSEVTFEEIEFRHIYTEDRISGVLDELKITISKEDMGIITEELESLLQDDPPLLKPNVKKTLEEISPNYQIGLISNTGVTPGKVLRTALNGYNILHLFDVTIFSDETGYFKPHPKMFEIPLKKLRCKAENAIHIGDGLVTDIKGANEFHITSVWFNDMKKVNSLTITPDYEIKEINEVLDIIRNLSD